ncbi:oligosaccharide flippase family protein [Haliangium sp.]|uniref:oligosaccharide flippase family protein n=1 Tax=Haliangium sp. TaxID=2663208 RepID=UPI003D11A8D9
MSIARQAARGAAWTLATGVGARIIGLGGTVVITHFLAPEVMGQVSAAAILVMTASLMTSFGFGNYLIVKGGDDPDVAFHMTAYNTFLAGLGFGALYLVADWASVVFDVPDAADYVPGLILARFIQRFGALPAKLLVKDLRFGRVGISVAAGEFTYVVTAVTLAALDFGGHAMVIGNIAQSTAAASITVTGVPWRRWLLPCRLRWARTVDMLRFGVPLGLGGMVGFATGSWDNLLYARLFGAHQMGLYNLAYNLAMMPATQIGDHLGTVLLPSMSKLAPDARRAALARALSLLALMVFPMSLGLATVAPSLVASFFDQRWQGLAPLITCLAAASVFLPVAWAMEAFWTAEDRTRTLLGFQLAKIVLILGGLVALSTLGPVWAATAIGLAMGVHATAGLGDCVRHGVPLRALWTGLWRPMAASVPMIAAVLGARAGLTALGVDSPRGSLAVEVTVGAAVYVPAVLVLAPRASRDLIGLAKQALRRGDD